MKLGRDQKGRLNVECDPYLPGGINGRAELTIMKITVRVVGGASAKSQARFQAGDIIRSRNSNAIGIVTAANYLSES
jgi:hypothetical protein